MRVLNPNMVNSICSTLRELKCVLYRYILVLTIPKLFYPDQPHLGLGKPKPVNFLGNFLVNFLVLAGKLSGQKLSKSGKNFGAKHK